MRGKPILAPFTQTAQGFYLRHVWRAVLEARLVNAQYNQWLIPACVKRCGNSLAQRCEKLTTCNASEQQRRAELIKAPEMTSSSKPLVKLSSGRKWERMSCGFMSCGNTRGSMLATWMCFLLGHCWRHCTAQQSGSLEFGSESEASLLCEKGQCLQWNQCKPPETSSMELPSQLLLL